ncbi:MULTISPECIES: 30S ribosomal protein S24e [Fervidicoccus]|uniref:Small ribosomal subunit protein eS24 n=1 Tax=Fervidicoccus fontis (strain DSM 19380 / JCM 18336 / VKM B-2539 / Kam940) TaxID=1163730 RepID=I0A2W6_FERFK|nr:30S ribosomal protein S24 [Fervidicoccus fontis]AFH43323.1 30S ribosomal protein S24E [Fervidicoccus fontis Kam940]
MSLNEKQPSQIIDLGDQLSLEIVNDVKNPLIGRREISGYVYHQGKGTPSLGVLRTKVAEKMKVDLGSIYVISLVTEYGIGRSKVLFHIYPNKKAAERFVPKYIIERNKTLQEEMQEAEEKEKKQKEKEQKSEEKKEGQ